MPFLIRFPDRSYAGHRIPGFASGIDVLPTIMDALNLNPDVSVPGRSLLPCIREDTPVRELVTCTNSRGMMVRTDTAKLWYNPLDGDGEMYDLEADPLELENLFDSTEHRELRRELFETMLDSRMKDDRRWSEPAEWEKRRHDEVHASYEPET